MARILVAEDDHSVREFVVRALELHGHAVVATTDGAEAMAAMATGEEEFDLLLADIKMPVMDGIALALRAARDRPQMPIVLMTGYSDQRQRAYGLDSLIACVIAKPFTLEQITEQVERVLAGSD